MPYVFSFFTSFTGRETVRQPSSAHFKTLWCSREKLSFLTEFKIKKRRKVCFLLRKSGHLFTINVTEVEDVFSSSL